MTSPKIHSQKQSGQAIVLIAVLLTALIGALGLAIDGGGMYLLYRDAQNAVDAAALTSAYALCTGGDPVEAGMRTLELNGFGSDRPDATPDVNNPPESGTYVGQTDKIEVIVNAVKPSYFIQIIYGGPLVVNVRAISRCDTGSTTIANSIEQQYAFRSLRDANECSTSDAWNIAGTRFTIEGDVWMPNVNTNIEFNSDNTPDPTFADNPADIIGDIYIGRSAAQQSIVDGTGREMLVEDLPNSPAGTVPFPSVYSGYGGDGTIEFSQSAPPGLTHNMDYYRPAGSTLCTTAECGGLQSLYPSNYFDVSAICASGNKFEYQDFGQNFDPSAFDFSTHYDVPNSEWIQPGIYYSTCQINLDHSNMNGNVSFISEEQIDMSPGPYFLSAFGEAPLLVSNKNSSGTTPPDVENCTGGQYAIQINGGFSFLQGVIIAFEGYVAIQGTDYVFETCINAAGIYQNGNSDSIFQCVPGTTVPLLPGTISIIE